jgi:hypothetical protein
MCVSIPDERKPPSEKDVLARATRFDVGLAHDIARLLHDRDEKIARFKLEGVPGRVHEVDKAFYDLAVQERNYARLQVDNREIIIGQLNARISRLEADLADRDQDLIQLQCEQDDRA